MFLEGGQRQRGEMLRLKFCRAVLAAFGALQIILRVVPQEHVVFVLGHDVRLVELRAFRGRLELFHRRLGLGVRRGHGGAELLEHRGHRDGFRLLEPGELLDILVGRLFQGELAADQRKLGGPDYSHAEEFFVRHRLLVAGHGNVGFVGGGLGRRQKAQGG